MQISFKFETTDLRKFPIIREPASPLSYGRKPRPVMATDGLPVGTQARFIAAAMVASGTGFPLNRLLTIRWISLFSANDVNPLRSLPVPARIDYLVELLRKWLRRYGCGNHYIWAREAAGSAGEHWHIAFHGKTTTDRALARYIAKRTGEPRAPKKRGAPQLTQGEFACGECGSWHLARDTQPDRRGYFLAAYLGKGEPSQYNYRGKLRNNSKKPVRGTSFGGTQPDGRYDSAQEMIEGTAHRKDRFFIAKPLQQTKKKTAAGHTPLVSQQISSGGRQSKLVGKRMHDSRASLQVHRSFGIHKSHLRSSRYAHSSGHITDMRISEHITYMCIPTEDVSLCDPCKGLILHTPKCFSSATSLHGVLLATPQNLALGKDWKVHLPFQVSHSNPSIATVPRGDVGRLADMQVGVHPALAYPQSEAHQIKCSEIWPYHPFKATSAFVENYAGLAFASEEAQFFKSIWVSSMGRFLVISACAVVHMAIRITRGVRRMLVNVGIAKECENGPAIKIHARNLAAGPSAMRHCQLHAYHPLTHLPGSRAHTS